MNWKVRVKNPYFWIGLAGVVISAVGVNVDTLTSWGALWQAIVDFVKNPFAIGSAIMAVLGVLLDPTTHGMKDSSLAMTYDCPKKETKE